MPKQDAATVAKTLRELAQRMELEGGNPYRARAYARAAENLSLSPESLDRLIKEGRLTEIPGIGDAILSIDSAVIESAKAARPPSVTGSGMLCPRNPSASTQAKGGCSVQQVRYVRKTTVDKGCIA
jgi:hypothetical protein